ncbi:MAG: hypothetical protein IIZ70_03215 [Kiritimatiellae bacterium]|nr:hypothetical protein [Kiritimatiellia bacterium]
MKFLKFACLGAVALALAGCGDSNAPANAKSEGAKAPAYEPMVAEGTVAALQYRKNESKAFAPMASAFAKCIDKGSVLHKQGVFDEEFAKFLDDSGLNDADVSWAMASLGEGFNLAKVASAALAPKVSVVVCFKHDAEKIARAFNAVADKDDGEKIEKFTVAGVTAWKFVSEDFPAGFVPCFASLDGELLLAAATEESLANEIALYRDGKGADASFGKVCSDKTAVVRLYVKSVGDLLKEATKDTPESLDAADKILPDGKNVFLGLGELDFALTASDPAGVAYALKLVTRSEEDAESIRSVLGGFYTMAKAQCKDPKDDEEKLFAEFLNAIKLKTAGNVFAVDMPISDALVRKAAEEMENAANEALGAGDEDDDDDGDDDGDDDDDEDDAADEAA